MSATTISGMYSLTTENMMHVLWDCTTANAMGLNLLPSRLKRSFFTSANEGKDWLKSNLVTSLDTKRT